MSIVNPAEPSNGTHFGDSDFVVVANRLPVDRDPDGENGEWRTSPGGLVTAVAPVMKSQEGAWIGWTGVADEDFEPFSIDGMHLTPVTLTSEDVHRYYEGFSNATLWPLYHDVIVPPEYHRTWWDAYVRVNERFAAKVAEVAAKSATVWVHDYQLQLVPLMVRRLRPDVSIGFFNHIPFPPYELFAQLPWRDEILRGLLGADLVGFQRPADAANFRRAVRGRLGFTTKGPTVTVPAGKSLPAHVVRAEAFPISIDTAYLERLAEDPDIIERARQIREDVGNPKIVMLGVDRMDYTKGIRHRLKAYGELLAEGRLNVEDVVLIQIATPSRERLEQYKIIRHDVELAVGRINGEQVDVGSIPVRYLHHSYPRDEMTAFFLAADVMLVTALRDGMNLVAKEYVACRKNDDGALVLSEFTGAAEQLKGAVMINPHDIGNLKAGILEAVEMDERTRRRRMRQLRKKVTTDTVSLWSENFLAELTHIKHNPEAIVPDGPVVPKRRTAAAADSPAAPSDRAHQPEEAGWAADISTAR
ncbi:trehalose-6-phosphate synthase [Brevibacterium sp. SMBL_HHYL_HB1]|jgi:trehalose 6-phosphate synthase|uniref:alpha,alpha-trehalose-phosphate synthase (UDP-forming) n=1 Tax=Brevibacterium sp. SMBL_HHYL_HB1 TaxID=2777556 RepID=UPI001BA5CDAD|nr:trehalose-6-phosphate synthase [Brevibacterium sp. SMBL_HHYL_HB1]QUL79423.1 trehalose-6-phosphate synthase [Brevibacterium sp. SMBL_HHYL_HB1]HJA60155.1 trehalose-6-phosphate synthase [Candidatus Brevibacterium intestinavium]